MRSEDKPQSVEASLVETWDQMNVEPDKIDSAIKILTEARRTLKDAGLMAAVRKRLEEQREAVAAAGKE